MAIDRRLVTDLLKLLPELGRVFVALCDLHVAQVDRQPLPDAVKARLRDATRPTQTQMQLAIELAQEGAASIRHLAGRLGVTPAAVSLLVDRMAENGWVDRIRDEHDRRVVWVRLTAAAQDISEALMSVQRAHIVAFLDEVPPDERACFVRNLARFARVMAGAPGGRDGDLERDIERGAGAHTNARSGAAFSHAARS
jgi:DNA-binding MarR family transcriptional regulator